LGFAVVSRIVKGGAFAIAFGGAKEQTVLGVFGQADETGQAGGIGSNLKIEFVKAAKAICDVHADVGGVHRLARIVVDGEIGGARTQAGVDGGNRFRVVGGVG
jgi:hypothetical protein